MSKIGKFTVALALGLMLSLSLLASGTFAQSVKHVTANKAAQVAVATSAVQAATQTAQTSSVQLTGFHGARWGGWGWGGGWGGGYWGGGWGGGYWGGGCGCW